MTCYRHNITRNSVLWRSAATCGVLRSLDGPVASVCRRRLSVTLCIVAKWCVLEQKLLLRAYRKSYVRNRLVPKWMTLTFVLTLLIKR